MGGGNKQLRLLDYQYLPSSIEIPYHYLPSSIVIPLDCRLPSIRPSTYSTPLHNYFELQDDCIFIHHFNIQLEAGLVFGFLKLKRVKIMLIIDVRHHIGVGKIMTQTNITRGVFRLAGK